MTRHSLCLRACLLAASATAVFLPQLAAAQDKGAYLSISGVSGLTLDSDNDGTFTGDFLTGPGTVVAAGSTIPAGASIDWTTGFEITWGGNIALGFKTGPKFDEGGFRGELELAYDIASVDTHEDAAAAGLPLGAEDAAVLLTSATDLLGITVDQLLDDGEGAVSHRSMFANAYYDIPLGYRVMPYVGGGIGWTLTDVEYSPSGLDVIDDTDEGVTWQLMAGATWSVDYSHEFFAGLRYRDRTDVGVQASLFPVDFDVESTRLLAEIGFRFNFG